MALSVKRFCTFSCAVLEVLIALLVVTAAYASIWNRRRPRNVRYSAICKDGRAFSRILSQHSNYNNDRKWKYTCSSAPITTTCKWHRLNTKYDQAGTLTCPNYGAITGEKSTFSRYHRDRVFSYRCCSLRNGHKRTCRNTGYLNKFDGDLRYRVSKGWYINGISSYHHNYYEDRRWKFTVCPF